MGRKRQGVDQGGALGVRVSLLGPLQIEIGGRPVEGLQCTKVQELLGFLLLRRDRSHSRESLAALLWEESEPGQERRRLRQTLWRLRSALAAAGEAGDTPLELAGTDWIHLRPRADLWLDVEALDRAYQEAEEVPGHRLGRDVVERIRSAIALYRGEFIEGLYCEWCLFERERLNHRYVVLLDKMMSYCLAHGECEQGIEYGGRILSEDRARECTHHALMRLYYLAGDRTAALRQYQRCVEALEEELGVAPARPIVELFEQICGDRLPGADEAAAARETAGFASEPAKALRRLLDLKGALSEARRQVQLEILALERDLGRSR